MSDTHTHTLTLSDFLTLIIMCVLDFIGTCPHGLAAAEVATLLTDVSDTHAHTHTDSDLQNIL